MDENNKSYGPSEKKPKMWSYTGGYLVAGKLASDDHVKDLERFVGDGEVLVSIPENTLLDFLCSDVVGSEVLKKVGERKKES